MNLYVINKYFTDFNDFIIIDLFHLNIERNYNFKKDL
jgi:hypothetical protein